MELRRSSSFDETQSREGRPERRDPTRFLRPDRSRSAPPDLQKDHQSAIEAAKTLETQVTQLIKDFEHFLTGLQTNRENNLFISEEQFKTYKILVQSYTLYKGLQFNFDSTRHNNYLTNSDLEKKSIQDDYLDKIKLKIRESIEPINSNGFIDFFEEYSQEFIDKTKSRVELAKDLECFLEEIQIKQRENLPLSKEQMDIHKKLTERTDNTVTDFENFSIKKGLYKDYYNENQYLQWDQDVRLIRSISDHVDNTVQKRRVAHPTYSDLIGQRTTIARRLYTLQESYEEKKQKDFPPSEYQRLELSKVIQLIDGYEATILAFSKTDDIKSLKNYEENRLRLDRDMVQTYKSNIELFLAPQEGSD